jgi:hypothetical protein
MWPEQCQNLHPVAFYLTEIQVTYVAFLDERDLLVAANTRVFETVVFSIHVRFCFSLLKADT